LESSNSWYGNWTNFSFSTQENNDLELVMPLIHEWRSDLWVVTQYTVVCYQLLLSIVLSVYYSVMQY